MCMYVYASVAHCSVLLAKILLKLPFLRLAEAKNFLFHCITHLSNQLSGQYEDKFSVCFTLAGCLHRLGYHHEALDKIKMALEIEEDPKAVWFCRLVERQVKYDDDRALRLHSALPEAVKLPTSIPVSLVLRDCV